MHQTRLCVLIAADKDKEKSPFERCEKTIAAMEKLDKQKPPKEGAIFFCGSSSIVKWDLEKSFPDLPVVKRGFGGSQIADSTHFAPRIKTFMLYFDAMNLNHDRYATEPGVHPPGVNFRFGVDWVLWN